MDALEGDEIGSRAHSTADFPKGNGHGLTLEEEADQKYAGEDNENEDDKEEGGYNEDEDDYDEDEDDYFDEEEDKEYEQGEIVVQPEYLQIREDVEFFSEADVPHYFVPASLEPGQMERLFWRATKQPVDREAYVIGLPPQLLKEFQEYVERDGMMEIARTLLYDTEPFGNEDHRLYRMDDGMNWAAKGPRWEGTDAIWFDPADEESFESLLSVLRRGGFDAVMDTIGKKFELEGLMVQGIGAMFLSHFDYEPGLTHIHTDMIGAEGTFYNVLIPVHTPESGYSMYVQDKPDAKAINMTHSVGLVIGADTKHGTGDCDYRQTGDFRLSFSVYMADIDDENVEIIASDPTSLWPTDGDIDWFLAQAGRLWSKDGKNSLENDKGRTPMNVQDQREYCSMSTDLCITDPAGFRLECAKTCGIYMEDDKYYSMLLAENASSSSDEEEL